MKEAKLPEEYAFPIQANDIEIGQSGMTLRDYFAGQALAALNVLNYTSADWSLEMAEVSYTIADAMIAEKANGTL